MHDVKQRVLKRKSYETYAGRTRRTRIDRQFCAHLIDMLRSPAWCVLSLSARRVLDRIEIELADHGGMDKKTELQWGKTPKSSGGNPHRKRNSPVGETHTTGHSGDTHTTIDISGRDAQASQMHDEAAAANGHDRLADEAKPVMSIASLLRGASAKLH